MSIIIFDTTLRDGEQSPGASMTNNEKLKIASYLADMGVDIIEAGFPRASAGDFEAVQSIAKAIGNKSTVCGLARAIAEDIKVTADAIKEAEKRRIHTFIATSDIHMKYKLNMDKSQVLDAIKMSVSLARNFTDDVEWSCEDGTRSDRQFLFKAVETAIASGATTINIPDTVGYITPDEYYELMVAIIENVPNSDKAIFSTHCHNDLGLAVANSLAGIRAGAKQIECTINGIGERAGNAAIEEIVMALQTRANYYGTKSQTNVDSTKLYGASKLLSATIGFNVQPNKAIVGANAFAHESGIHQHGMLRNSLTYEIMKPEDVGRAKSDIVLGKHSGRHALRKKIINLGYDNLDDDELNATFDKFKKLCDNKKEVYDDDIIALIETNHPDRENSYKIKFISVDVVCGSANKSKADILIEVDGTRKHSSCHGNGPIDAVFNAIKLINPHNFTLKLYQVHAVTSGTDAQASVTVRLEDKNSGYISHGISADYDTIKASAIAYIEALNRAISKLTN
jgi:2-isopropylmalate synthase